MAHGPELQLLQEVVVGGLELLHLPLAGPHDGLLVLLSHLQLTDLTEGAVQGERNAVFLQPQQDHLLLQLLLLPGQDVHLRLDGLAVLDLLLHRDLLSPEVLTDHPQLPGELVISLGRLAQLEVESLRLLPEELLAGAPLVLLDDFLLQL